MQTNSPSAPMNDGTQASEPSDSSNLASSQQGQNQEPPNTIKMHPEQPDDCIERAVPSSNLARHLLALQAPSQSQDCESSILGELSVDVPLPVKKISDFRIKSSDISDSIPVPSSPRIGKPGKETFFMVYGNEDQWDRYFIYTPKGEFGNTHYVVAPDIAELLGAIVTEKRLVPCMSWDGDPFFWPLTISDRSNGYWDSARIIAGEARTEWRRMVADLKANEYKAWKPRFPKPAPVWPTKEEWFSLLTKAMEGKVIDSIDHPEVIKLL